MGVAQACQGTWRIVFKLIPILGCPHSLDCARTERWGFCLSGEPRGTKSMRRVPGLDPEAPNCPRLFPQKRVSYRIARLWASRNSLNYKCYMVL